MILGHDQVLTQATEDGGPLTAEGIKRSVEAKVAADRGFVAEFIRVFCEQNKETAPQIIDALEVAGFISVATLEEVQQFAADLEHESDVMAITENSDPTTDQLRIDLAYTRQELRGIEESKGRFLGGLLSLGPEGIWHRRGRERELRGVERSIEGAIDGFDATGQISAHRELHKKHALQFGEYVQIDHRFIVVNTPENSPGDFREIVNRIMSVMMTEVQAEPKERRDAATIRTQIRKIPNLRFESNSLGTVVSFGERSVDPTSLSRKELPLKKVEELIGSIKTHYPDTDLRELVKYGISLARKEQQWVGLWNLAIDNRDCLGKERQTKLMLEAYNEVLEEDVRGSVEYIQKKHLKNLTVMAGELVKREEAFKETAETLPTVFARLVWYTADTKAAVRAAEYYDQLKKDAVSPLPEDLLRDSVVEMQKPGGSLRVHREFMIRFREELGDKFFGERMAQELEILSSAEIKEYQYEQLVSNILNFGDTIEFRRRDNLARKILGVATRYLCGADFEKEEDRLEQVCSLIRRFRESGLVEEPRRVISVAVDQAVFTNNATIRDGIRREFAIEQ